jgi:hypothetical protein
MPVIHGPQQGPDPAPGSIPVPAELFLWSIERSRWAGTPADIRSMARRLIEEVAKHHKLGTMTFIDLSINIPYRSWGADTPERLEEDLRVHRRVVRSVRLEVLVVQRGQVVADVRSIPTKKWKLPTSAFYSETPALPVHAAVTLSRTGGARLEVRSTTGLEGERIYDSLRPFLSNGVRWQVPRRLLIRPVRLVLPHFEITIAGRTHWRAIGAGLLTAIGLLGGVGVIAAGVKAGVDAVLTGHDHHAAQLDRQPAATGAGVGRLAFHNGQIAGGDIFRIENVTRHLDFAERTKADPCDRLLYRLRLYNPGGSAVANVLVQAEISNEAVTSNTATIQASAADADPSTTYAFAAVRLPSPESLAYVPGSTQLLNQEDGLLKALPDGITTGGTGVRIGTLGSGVSEAVQFVVRVGCSTRAGVPSRASATR